MSENLQSAGAMGQVHPDADQLTAFAEQALPLHEREQTLAHLAECAGCRQIVFLAQQAAEDELAMAAPVRVRRPWFAGWNLVWPALVAVAGMVAFSVHLRNLARPVVTVGTATTEAAVSPPAPSIAPLDAPVSPKASGIAPVKAKAAAGQMTADSLSMNAGANDAGSVEELKTLPQANPATATKQVQGGLLGGFAGAGAANAPVTMAAPAPLIRNAARSGPAAQQMQSAPMQAMVQGQAVDQAKATGEVVQPSRFRAVSPAFSAGAVAAAPAAAPAAKPAAPSPAPPLAMSGTPSTQAKVAAMPPIRSAAETVTVEAANAAPMLDTALMDAMVAEGEPAKPRLMPSHLAAMSSAKLDGVWLVVDTAGGLFWSKDEAKHWKRVKQQWDEMAIKVSVAASGTGPFELRTAAGTVWTSSDGQHWKRR